MSDLSPIAEQIFNMKYRLHDKEDWNLASWRVAITVANAERNFNKDDSEIINTATEFFNIIRERFFIPGGRILKNSGTGVKNLYNCFFFNVEDSRISIYQCLKDAAEVFAWGGGLGIRLSDLREEGALIRSTGTYSSGPLSFMELFNSTGDVIQQASRRAAEIALLDVSHPDIKKYLRYKSTLSKKNKNVVEEFRRNLNNLDRKEYNLGVLEKTLIDSQLNHFNISVEIPDKFMQAVINDEDWNLISPSTKEVKETIKAKELLMEMAYQIWSSGDPGIFFTDAVNKDNMVDYISDKMGCNPCAEINLISYEPCCLGSINLYKFVEDGRINLELLENVVRISVRFLDDIHEISNNNVPKINEMAQSLRRIGLGVFGFADMLAELNIPYNSPQALSLAEKLSWFISFFAWLESIELAKERGPFPAYNKDKANFSVIEKVLNSDLAPSKFDIDYVREVGVRNVSVTALAPTGSIALLGEANSVIEPFYALAYRRNITLGEANLAKKTIVEINPILERKLKELNLSEDKIKEIMDEVIRTGSIQKCDVPDSIKKVFVTAHDISVEDHINMQASWQKYISNAISKTINMPSSATPKNIYDALISMWKAGLKSSTIYRNGSKSFQILDAGN